MLAAFEKCIGTRQPNGRLCCTAALASQPSTLRDKILLILWYFPSSIPHSIQGLNPDGCEFLLVFNDGDFNEDNTFLLSDWFKHTPNEVLSKNFGVPGCSFAHVPGPS